MKFSTVLPLALASLNGASAFVPVQQRSFVRPAVVTYMADDEVDAAPAPAPVVAPAADAAAAPGPDCNNINDKVRTRVRG